MKRLVFDGKTFEFRGDDKPEPVPQLADIPKQPQRARTIKRVHLSIVPAVKEHGNGYRPGPFLHLANDQCKYTVTGTTMCGAKVGRPQGSWCDHHAFIVRFGSRALEAAE